MRRLLAALCLIPAASVADAFEQTVHAGTVQGIVQAIKEATPHTTILVEDGHYMLPHYLEITADHVTLRSASGKREAVILDGADSRHNELLGIRNASQVTLADLTFQNITANGIKINNDTPVHHVTIRNCILRNIWQRGIKSVRSPELKSHNGLIEHCLFINDRAKSYSDDPSDTAGTFGGDYIGGIDLMDAVGWTIRDNVFRHLQGRTRTGRGAIFVWFESADCVIERNIIIDCDQGIALGNPHKTVDCPYHVRHFMVRNNVIIRAPMNPIFIAHSHNTRVLHNTVHDPENPRHRSVRIFADNPGLDFSSNLIHGHPIREEDRRGEISLTHNFQTLNALHHFADPDTGDLRLTATGRGVVPPIPTALDAPLDFHDIPRGDQTRAGAHHP